MFMGLEEPANFGDVGGLGRVGVDLVQYIIHFAPKTEVKFLWWGVESNQETKIQVSLMHLDWKLWE